MRSWSRRLAAACLLLFTACPGPRHGVSRPDELRVVDGEIDAQRLLKPAVTRAAEAGAVDLEAVGARAVIEGEQLGSFVEVPAKDCALVLARGGRSVTDIDLFAYTDGGDRIASDEAPDPRAAVMVCPPHPRRIYIVARSVAGEGMIALGVMRVPAAAADAVSKALDVRGRPGEDTGKLAQWPGLERAIRERRASLGSKWEDVRRVAVPLSPRAQTSVTAEIGANRCLDVFVMPSEEVQGIDLMVVDGRGRTVARGKPPARERGVVVCARAASVITIVIRPRISSGLAAVILARSEPGSIADIADGAWVDGPAALLPIDEALARHAKRVASLRLEEPKQVGRGMVTTLSPTEWTIDVAAGCSRIDVVGGAPLGPFSASLWGMSGRRISRTSGAEHAGLFTCGGPRKLRVEAKAMDVGGEVAIEVRRDASPPSAFVKQPVAAARLLDRLDAVAGPIDVDAAAGARAVSLSQTATRLPVSMGSGSCADVVAAAGPGAAGLTMVVRVGGQDQPPSRGDFAVGQRICAGPKAGKVTAALRVASGEGTGLFIARPVDGKR